MAVDLLAAAQHEAAHVVVGLALGMKLREATIDPSAAMLREHGRSFVAFTWFPDGSRLETAVMYAAGIAWEREAGSAVGSWGDRARLRELGFRSKKDQKALARSAWALLSMRAGAHARITRALLRGGRITARDVARMMQGETDDE